jgi:hypothetical protein
MQESELCAHCRTLLERNARIVLKLRHLAATIHQVHAETYGPGWWQCPLEPCCAVQVLVKETPCGD